MHHAANFELTAASHVNVRHPLRFEYVKREAFYQSNLEAGTSKGPGSLVEDDGLFKQDVCWQGWAHLVLWSPHDLRSYRGYSFGRHLVTFQ